jgi:hypothetical protein
VDCRIFLIVQDIIFGGLERKQYNHVPDHVLVNNHAVLMLSQFNQTVALLADVDEFFVPQASRRLVLDYYHVISRLELQ